MFALPPLASTPGDAGASAEGGRAGGDGGFADTLAGALLGDGDPRACALSALRADGEDVDPQSYRVLGGLLGLRAGHADALSPVPADREFLDARIVALADGDTPVAEELAAALLGEDVLAAGLTEAFAGDAVLREGLAGALLTIDALADRHADNEALAALLEGRASIDEVAAALTDGDLVASALAALLASAEGRSALEGLTDEDGDGEVGLRLAALLDAARSVAGRAGEGTDAVRAAGRQHAGAVRAAERGEGRDSRGHADAVRAQSGAVRADAAEDGEEATDTRLGQRLDARLVPARGRVGGEADTLPPRADRAGDAGLRGLVTASETRASAPGLLPQRAAEPMMRAEPSAMAARIAEVAEQLEKAGPPRRMTVEIGELRLSVSLRADSSVRVSVLSGQAPGEQAWRDGLEQALAERGLLLADEREQRGQPDPHGHAAPKPASQPPRPAAFAASASDDDRGLRL